MPTTPTRPTRASSPTRTAPRSPSPSRHRQPRALCHDWDTEQVCAWLSRAVGLPQYARHFRQARIDGPGLLHLFTHERAGVAGPASPPRAYHRHHHLHAFAAPSSVLERVVGVYDAGHKRRILEGIGRLKDGDGGTGAFEPGAIGAEDEQRPRGRLRRCGGCMPPAQAVAAPAKREVGPRRAAPVAARVSGGTSRPPQAPPRVMVPTAGSSTSSEEEEEPSSLRKVTTPFFIPSSR